jgi:predicted DNA-binding transcriptional regulator AlpA
MPNVKASAFWSHQETAEYLGIPSTTLHQLNYRGVGPRSFKIGRHRKYRPADVDAWCESHASQPITTQAPDETSSQPAPSDTKRCPA